MNTFIEYIYCCLVVVHLWSVVVDFLNGNPICGLQQNTWTGIDAYRIRDGIRYLRLNSLHLHFWLLSSSFRNLCSDRRYFWIAINCVCLSKLSQARLIPPEETRLAIDRNIPMRSGCRGKPQKTTRSH
jgi:hypothetical protein